MRVAAQRVADQDDVVARRRQRSISLVGDTDGVQASFRSRAASGSRRARETACPTVPTEPAAAFDGGRGHASDHIRRSRLMVHARFTSSGSGLIRGWRRRLPMYESQTSRDRSQARASSSSIEGASRWLDHERQQRRERRCTAGGEGSAEGRAAGGQVQVAGVLQMAERHAQRDSKVAGLLRTRRRNRNTRPSSRSTRIIRKSSRPKISARRQSSTCSSAWRAA